MTPARVVLPVVMLVFSLVVLVAAVLRFWSAGIVYPKPIGPWPSGAFVAVVGAFMFGGVLGGLRSLKKGVTAGVATHVGVTVMLLLVTAAWYYETTAVAGGFGWLPITTYVMSVRGLEPDWTLLFFILTTLMLGRWLWLVRRLFFL